MSLESYPVNYQGGISSADQCLQMKCGGICAKECTYWNNWSSNNDIHTKLSLLEELEHDGVISREEKENASMKLAALLLPTEYTCRDACTGQNYEYIQLRNIMKDCSVGNHKKHNHDFICTCIDSGGSRAGGDNCRLCLSASYTWVFEVLQTITTLFDSACCRTTSDTDDNCSFSNNSIGKPIEAINYRKEDDRIAVRCPTKGTHTRKLLSKTNEQVSEELKEEVALNYIADATNRDGVTPVKRSSFFATRKRLSQSFYG